MDKFLATHTPKIKLFTSDTLRNYLPAIIWALVIAYLSTMGGINLPQSLWEIVAVDKIGHFLVYAILVILLLIGLKKSKLDLSTKRVTWVLLSCIGYSIMLEFVQLYFFPHRYFEYLDILANIIGCTLGYLVYKFLINKFL